MFGELGPGEDFQKSLLHTPRGCFLFLSRPFSLTSSSVGVTSPPEAADRTRTVPVWTFLTGLFTGVLINVHLTPPHTADQSGIFWCFINFIFQWNIEKKCGAP